jgi:hypothetical protein
MKSINASSSVPPEQLTKWVEYDKELDLTKLLEQNLEVEKVRVKLLICCEKISKFWQLYNSPNLSHSDFDAFLALLAQISTILTAIRA